jgi:putative heme-binding domain-containing protein
MSPTTPRAAGAALAIAAMLAAFAPGSLAQEPLPPELVAPTEARTPEQERKGFRLPEGFRMQLVASEPTIDKPMNIAFDDLGRLWVTSTLEYPYPAPPGQKPRDRVVILDDFGPDGLARKATTFADALNIPIGLMPIAGGKEALVHTIPDIQRLTDTDGDGKADTRETLYSGYGFRDTHGMTNAFTWGFDGWIYACHGFNNESAVKGTDGKPVSFQSGNTYRFKADGSHLEYYTHGQVNPFGIGFDPLGNLYSADCHTRPIFSLLRGAYYPSFGKPHDGIGYGPEMMTHDHGSTGIGGLTYYTADQFPAAYRDSIFIGNVVTSRINNDRLEHHGSTGLAIPQPDFVVSDDPWFRPVDIKLGPDGALYVADFYNRIIGHYEVPLTHPGRDRHRGRIWRITYEGKDAASKPAKAPRADWTKASVADLTSDQAHPNLSVRTRATNQLVSRGSAEVIDALKATVKGDQADARVQALWALARLKALDEPTLAARAADPDAAVRTHAQKVVGELDDLTPAREALAKAGLADPDAYVRRAAAEALGRHPNTSHLAPLVALIETTAADDTHLRHVARMALRDELRPDAAWQAVGPIVGKDKARATIADVALGVPSAPAAHFLLETLAAGTAGPNSAELAHHVARYGEAADTAALFALARKAGSADLNRSIALLKAIQQGAQERGEPRPEARAWAVELTGTALRSTDDGIARAGIDLATAFALPESSPLLAGIAADARAPEPRRLAAINAISAIDPGASVVPLVGVLADAQTPAGLRDQAALALARTNRPEALARLVEALPTAPGRLQAAIAAGLAGSKEGTDALLAAVTAGKASARLLQDRTVEVKLKALNLPNLADRLKPLLAGLPPADEKLLAMLAARRDRHVKVGGSSEAGRLVFEKNCTACHQIGGKGAKVGPQLDGVGGRGVERLVEDILDSNRNVDQAFRSTNLALTNGQVISGLLLREEGQVLVLADAQGKEVRVPGGQVEERVIAQISPMPANFAEQIPEADFDNLLSYLLGQKPPAAEKR